jgi:hypothetical protein
MVLKESQGIYQGILTTSIVKIDGVTDYLNEIKESFEIDKEEKAAYFYLKDEGQVITQPTEGKFCIMCTNLSREVANRLEKLI